MFYLLINIKVTLTHNFLMKKQELRHRQYNFQTKKCIIVMCIQ